MDLVVSAWPSDGGPPHDGVLPKVEECAVEVIEEYLTRYFRELQPIVVALIVLEKRDGKMPDYVLVVDESRPGRAHGLHGNAVHNGDLTGKEAHIVGSALSVLEALSQEQRLQAQIEPQMA